MLCLSVEKKKKKGKQSLPHLTSIFFLVRVQIMSELSQKTKRRNIGNISQRVEIGGRTNISLSKCSLQDIPCAQREASLQLPFPSDFIH